MWLVNLKRILRLGRLRLRGPRGTQNEFVLATITQNLWRPASLIVRPPLAWRRSCVESVRGRSKPTVLNKKAGDPLATTLQRNLPQEEVVASAPTFDLQ
jgi:hypothetical protein